MAEAPGELLAGAEAKSCCAAVYESEAVRWLLDGQLHPGGEALTLRLGELAGIEAGQRVLDVASGTGSSARLLARELGAEIVGLDYGEEAVAGATAAAVAEGLGERVEFIHGDAEALPFPDGSFDAVVCECSLCTFPDKPTAVAEMARVLRPGGAAAIADMTADPAALPPALRDAAAQVACVADALPLQGYARLFEAAGFEVVATERHDAALRAMIDRAEARLRAARILRLPQLGGFTDQVEEGIELARLAARTVEDGRLGYGVLVARTPFSGADDPARAARRAAA